MKALAIAAILQLCAASARCVPLEEEKQSSGAMFDAGGAAGLASAALTAGRSRIASSLNTVAAHLGPALKRVPPPSVPTCREEAPPYHEKHLSLFGKAAGLAAYVGLLAALTVAAAGLPGVLFLRVALLGGMGGGIFPALKPYADEPILDVVLSIGVGAALCYFLAPGLSGVPGVINFVGGGLVAVATNLLMRHVRLFSLPKTRVVPPLILGAVAGMFAPGLALGRGVGSLGRRLGRWMDKR